MRRCVAFKIAKPLSGQNSTRASDVPGIGDACVHMLFFLIVLILSAKLFLIDQMQDAGLGSEEARMHESGFTVVPTSIQV